MHRKVQEAQQWQGWVADDDDVVDEHWYVCIGIATCLLNKLFM